MPEPIAQYLWHFRFFSKLEEMVPISICLSWSLGALTWSQYGVIFWKYIEVLKSADLVRLKTVSFCPGPRSSNLLHFKSFLHILLFFNYSFPSIADISTPNWWCHSKTLPLYSKISFVIESISLKKWLIPFDVPGTLVFTLGDYG